MCVCVCVSHGCQGQQGGKIKLLFQKVQTLKNRVLKNFFFVNLILHYVLGRKRVMKLLWFLNL